MPTGKKALITGGSRGIGLAIAACFRGAGIETITPTRAELDLSSVSSIDGFFKSLSIPIDILVNNAGINLLGTLEAARTKDFETVVSLNLMTPMRLCSYVVPGMKDRGYGRIVNVASIFGLVSRERRLSYTSSKAGLIGFTTALAVELGPHNILVNAIAPGYVETDLTRKNNSPQDLEAIKKSIPMRRLAQPHEIAETALFLCSDRNTYITGQTLAVDGGFLCQ